MRLVTCNKEIIKKLDDCNHKIWPKNMITDLDSEC